MKKKLILLFFMFALSFVLLPSSAFAESNESSSPTPGWSEDGKSYYHPDGYYVTGLVNIEGKWYFFDDNNILQTNRWILYLDQYYFASEDGSLLTNKWKEYKGEWYYFDEFGVMVSDRFQEINGKEYYFDKSGAMKTGWISITYEYEDEESYTVWYYADKNGVLKKNSWVLDKGKWYYLNEYGIMYVGLLEINGKSYYFDKSGAMKTGWISNIYDYGDGEKYTEWYYADSNGVIKTNTWFYEKNRWYYFDYWGRMVVGVYSIKGKDYLFNRDGSLSSGGWVYDTDYDNWFYADSNGHPIKSRWIFEKNKWYYLSDWGAAETGVAEINGVLYFFNDDGSLASKEGWKYIDEVYFPYWIFVNKDGTLATGWKHYGGKWYYLNPYSGKMSTGFDEINGKQYYFDTNNGELITNQWIKDSYYDEYSDTWYHDWYYATANGTLATNSWIKFQADGKWYYLDSNGLMVKDGPNWVNGVLYYFNADGSLLEKEGWVTDRYNEKYYVNADGTVKIGLWKIGDSWYYFNPYSGNLLYEINPIY